MILVKRDLMTPIKVAGDVISTLPDVTVVALDGAGHSLMAEKPDGVLDNLIAFLA